MKKTLAVVFEKSYEPATHLIKALIETKDDKIDDNGKHIVGVEDDTVSVMVLNEKQYFDNKMKFSSSQKILFIGDVKEKDSLELIMDVLYDKHGIRIGKSGNQLLITTNVLSLVLPNAYKEFVNEFKEISNNPVSNKKRAIGFNTETVGSIGICSIPIMKIGTFLIPGIGPWIAGGWLGKRAINDKRLIKQQQMIFAVSKVYFDFLDSFMKA